MSYDICEAKRGNLQTAEAPFKACTTRFGDKKWYCKSQRIAYNSAKDEFNAAGCKAETRVEKFKKTCEELAGAVDKAEETCDDLFAAFDKTRRVLSEDLSAEARKRSC